MYLPDFIFYHKNCADGMGALLACDMALKDLGHDYRAYPIQYNEPFPVDLDVIEGKNILFVDYCPKPDAGMALAAVCSSVVILDHHKTAKEDCLEFIAFDGTFGGLCSVRGPNLPAKPYVHFDMTKSGAHLAWRFYHPLQTLPALLAYIEDRDIWKWELPKSEAVNAFIGAMDVDLDDYYDLAQNWDRAHIVSQGEAILLYRDKLVGDVAARATASRLHAPGLPPVEVLMVVSSVLHSEIGNVLAEQSPTNIGIVLDVRPEGPVKASMRAKKPVDITPYVKALGGGGHAQAGGFVFDNIFAIFERVD